MKVNSCCFKFKQLFLKVHLRIEGKGQTMIKLLEQKVLIPLCGHGLVFISQNIENNTTADYAG